MFRTIFKTDSFQLSKKKDTIGQNPNPTSNTSSTNNADKKDKKQDNWFNRTANKVGKYISDNPETIIDGIGLSSNIIGGLVSHKMNRDMLNKLKYNRAPIETFIIAFLICSAKS